MWVFILSFRIRVITEDSNKKKNINIILRTVQTVLRRFRSKDVISIILKCRKDIIQQFNNKIARRLYAIGRGSGLGGIWHGVISFLSTDVTLNNVMKNPHLLKDVMNKVLRQFSLSEKVFPEIKPKYASR